MAAWQPRPQKTAKAPRDLIPDGRDGTGLDRYLSSQGQRLIASRERHFTVFGKTYVFIRLPSPRERSHSWLRLGLWSWSVVPVHLTLATKLHTPWPTLTVAFVSLTLMVWAYLAFLIGRADVPKRPPGHITVAQIVAPVLALGSGAPLVPLFIAGGLQSGLWVTDHAGLLLGAAMTVVLVITSIVLVTGALLVLGEVVCQSLGWRHAEALLILPPPFVVILLIDVAALKL